VKAIVAANGGSDLIYVPNGSKETVQKIVERLLGYDYIGGIFVDDKFGAIPGTLPLNAINLAAFSSLPRPAIAVAFKVFYSNYKDLQTAFQISDTQLEEGQGMHGGFGRDSTYNNMAAIGPDFKHGYADEAPVSNADIVPTLARLLGLDFKAKGKLKGRIVNEAIEGAPDALPTQTRQLVSEPANGMRTVLDYLEFANERYSNGPASQR